MFKRHTHCRICSEALPEPFLDLGLQPLANNLSDVPNADVFRAPLQVTRCGHCGLVQLTAVVDPGVLFSEYLYTPDQSATFRKHFEDMAKELSGLLSPGDLVCDIGSNSGLLLQKFLDHTPRKIRVAGVEPARNLVSDANRRGIRTYEGFWDSGIAAMIRDLDGPAKLITATNVFAHCDDLHGFMRGVDALLSADGTLVIEVPALPVMLRDGTWDLIYHEHLSFFDPYPVGILCEMHGFRLSEIAVVPVHGGSYRFFIRRRSADEGAFVLPAQLPWTAFDRFGSRALQTRDTLLRLIRDAHGRVVGYGAPAKATVLISFLGLTAEDVAYIVDDSPLKRNLYIPGTGIQVVSPERLDTDPADIAVVFPWNLASEIIQKLDGRVRQVIIPMPDPILVEVDDAKFAR